MVHDSQLLKNPRRTVTNGRVITIKQDLINAYQLLPGDRHLDSDSISLHQYQDLGAWQDASDCLMAQ
jgi:hypothetical protein